MCFGHAGEHVVLAAAMNCDLLLGGPGCESVIGIRGRGGKHDCVDGRATAKAAQQPSQGGLTKEVNQGLARKSRGRHSGLNAGDDAGHSAGPHPQPIALPVDFVKRIP
jgi:hypothetical protein